MEGKLIFSPVNTVDPANTAGYERMLEEIASGTALGEAAIRHNKRIIMEAMKRLGITQAVVTYDGEGDSGGIEDVQIEGGEGAADETLVLVRVISRYRFSDDHSMTRITEIFEGSESNFEDVISEFADDLIDHAGHGGYENNEGGYGEVTIVAPDDDDPEGLITVDHNDRIITTQNTVSTF